MNELKSYEFAGTKWLELFLNVGCGARLVLGSQRCLQIFNILLSGKAQFSHELVVVFSSSNYSQVVQDKVKNGEAFSLQSFFVRPCNTF